ncbi:IS110 family transposase [Rhodococcus sp. NPDC055112]
MTETVPDVSLTVCAGVDTHKDTHHAAIVDHLGRQLADREFPADPAGYRHLIDWIADCGVVTAVGVEGTGTYGAALTTSLQAAGLTVLEVDRPDRRARRSHGKSDPVDAYAAATAALTGRAATVPKSRGGDVEAIRLLHKARRSAVKDRAEAITTLKSIIVTAPEQLREQLRGLTRGKLIGTCVAFRPESVITGGLNAAAKTSLRSIARRIAHLTAEITELDRDLSHLTRRAAPELLELSGVGPDTAAQLLITVGDNRERITSEAALASTCGVAPIQASSGKTCRHRLNRGGDRQANRALHTIVLSRLQNDPRTKAYRDRRLAEGKTKREIIRCLKRAVAREIYRVLTSTERVDNS